MIWCFEFFFLGLNDDLDEGSQQGREMLALSRLREIVQRPDKWAHTTAKFKVF